jgi:hypothetical protein
VTVLGVCVAVAAWALDSAPTAAQQPTPGARVAPAPDTPVLAPPPLTVPPSSYARKGRRDPFLPVVIQKPPEEEEELPTIAARLTGIVRGTATRALLETADGVGYVLQLGDTLGTGRLVEIGRDSVVFNVAAKRGSKIHRVLLRLPSE